MGPADDVSVTEMLTQMSSVLLSEQTVDEILQLVTELTERTVRSASAVSVTLVRGNATYTPNASEPIARELDEVQYAADDGPCLDAARQGQLVNTTLAGGQHHDRWPAFTKAALARGMGGILSVPLAIGAGPLGALNVYSRQPRRFDPTEATTATLLANQAAIVLTNAVAFSDATALNGQLSDALETRDLIGQAKGILMERERCNAEMAFDILRRASQRTNRKLREIAVDLVATTSSTDGRSS